MTTRTKQELELELLEKKRQRQELQERIHTQGALNKTANDAGSYLIDQLDHFLDKEIKPIITHLETFTTLASQRSEVAIRSLTAVHNLLAAVAKDLRELSEEPVTTQFHGDKDDIKMFLVTWADTVKGPFLATENHPEAFDDSERVKEVVSTWTDAFLMHIKRLEGMFKTANAAGKDILKNLQKSFITVTKEITALEAQIKVA